MSSLQSPIAFALAGFAQGTVQLHTQLSTFKYDPNDLIDSPGLPMTEVDMENFKKAQANVITPPTTQGSSFVDEFETEDEQDQLIIPSTSTAPPITAPLFQVEPTAQKPILPGKFNKTFDYHLFGEFMAAVHTCADSPLRLCEYLGKGIKVTLYERRYFRHEHVRERITYEELWNRATRFLSLEIPGFEPELGMEHTARFFSTGHMPWFFAGRLAFEGKLDDVPIPTTAGFLEAKWFTERSLPPRSTKASISNTARLKKQGRGRQTHECQNRGFAPTHDHLLEPREPSGRTRRLSPKAAAELGSDTSDELSKGRSSGRKISKSYHVTLYYTPTNSQASNDSDTPEPAASIESTELVSSVSGARSKAPSRKRKRDTTDASSPISTKAAKRTAFDFNNNAEGPPGRFAQAVKHFLNEKSSNASDYAAFADGRGLCPSDGPGSEKYKEEMALAEELKFTEGPYKTQKYRSFLAAAMLTEQNIRMEQHKAAGKKVDMNPLNLNKTQMQLYNNVDVNKSSKLFTKFRDFGWIPDSIIVGTDKKKSVNPVYKTMFPAEKRKALLDELMAFEATKVTDEKKRVVKPSLD